MLKKVKMIIYIFIAYIFISTAAYFVLDGFYFTRNAKKANQSNQKIELEFLPREGNKVIKGVYVGEFTKNGYNCSYFQFKNVLKNKDPNEERFFDVYLSDKKDKKVFVSESRKQAEGVEAYLTTKRFSFLGLNQNIEKVLDTLNIDAEQKSELYLVFANVSTSVASNFASAEMLKLQKQDQTINYQYSELYVTRNDEFIQINRLHSQTPSRQIVIFNAFIDILSGGVQGIVIVAFFIAVAVFGISK